MSGESWRLTPPQFGRAAFVGLTVLLVTGEPVQAAVVLAVYLAARAVVVSLA